MSCGLHEFLAHDVLHGRGCSQGRLCTIHKPDRLHQDAQAVAVAYETHDESQLKQLQPFPATEAAYASSTKHLDQNRNGNVSHQLGLRKCLTFGSSDGWDYALKSDFPAQGSHSTALFLFLNFAIVWKQSRAQRLAKPSCNRTTMLSIFKAVLLQPSREGYGRGGCGI